MKYEFHTEINRLNTASEKWDEAVNLYGGKDILPMCVNIYVKVRTLSSAPLINIGKL